MMILSSKCVYGVHALFELALHYGKKSVRIREIAGAQGIPEDYLRQLLVILKRAELVKSVRGVQGGYALARSPSLITVGEIIEVLEGSLNPVSLGAEERVFQNYWKRCSDSIKGVFNTTLEILVLEKQKLDKSITYHI